MSGLRERVLRTALRALRLVPDRPRAVLTGFRSPAYRIGASCLIVRDDGAWLLVRHSYRRGWSLPGGGTARHEGPADAAHREMREELGVGVELGESFPVIDPRHRRVTFLFPARVVEGEPMVRSVEIEEVRWFDPASLPTGDRWLGQVEAAARRHLSGDHPGLVVPEEL